MKSFNVKKYAFVLLFSLLFFYFCAQKIQRRNQIVVLQQNLVWQQKLCKQLNEELLFLHAEFEKSYNIHKLMNLRDQEEFEEFHFIKEDAVISCDKP